MKEKEKLQKIYQQAKEWTDEFWQVIDEKISQTKTQKEYDELLNVVFNHLLFSMMKITKHMDEDMKKQVINHLNKALTDKIT